ncbi:MAG: putative folate metabolism gamma-glutamate ligase [Candidatus Pacebacteria bacterium]|nr:putative folate metabolism gamma-glutamate ligase [Candidatus Paceibacterota bacterium]
MKITAIKTPIVQPNDDLKEVIKNSIDHLAERSVVVIASKIFSTSENRFVEKNGDPNQKIDLIKSEADKFTDPHSSKYNLMMTIKGNILFVNAGIDESNANNQFILWPADPQQSVNEIWEFLKEEYNLKEVGVTMSDSASQMLNWGVVGRAIAYCGFNPLRSYVGTKDLFGKEMKMEKTNVMQSLTDAAVLEMGEGAEQTPIGIVEDISNIEFQDHVPTKQELDNLKINIEDDAFAPILTTAEWKTN